MDSKIKIFLDSDVVISSLISPTGAAYLLVYETDLAVFVSNLSAKELRIVVKRFNLDVRKLKKILTEQMNLVKLTKERSALEKQFGAYVTDPRDSHIVAGAVYAKARFLVTYNVKHFLVDKIKRDFKINLLTPAQLLQYLRSQV